MKLPGSFWLLLAVGVGARAIEAATAVGLGIAEPDATWLIAPLIVVGAAAVDAAALGWAPPLPRLAPVAAIYLALQPAFYRLFQAPLTGDQIALAGDLRDLSGSALAAAPWWSWTLVACAAAASALARGRQIAPGRPGWAAAAVCLTAWALTPAGALAGVERSAVAALLPSPSAEAPDVDPSQRKLDRTPLTEQPAVEALSNLVAAEGFPRKGANVVLWALESTSTRLMGYGGPGLAQTMPELAALADRGVSFDRYYAITPVSMKSLVSMTCSIHPYTRPQALTYVHPTIPCADLATELKSHGYRTGLVHAGHFHYSDKDRFFRPRGYELMVDADPIQRRHGGDRNAWGVDDASMVDAAIAWLSTLSPDERFFLLVIPVSPHHPYGGDYRAALRGVDREIGRLRRAVEARWPAERTLHVLAGDHGEAFEEHPGHTMHGSYIYDEAMRVPLVLSNPSMFQAGARSSRLGNHVDLAPTILDALDLPIPERQEGVSLLRGFRPHLVHLYTEYAHHQLGLIDGRFKYILDMDVGSEQVFDLLSDPGETRNLASAHPGLTPRWRAEVRRFEAFYQALIPHYSARWFPDRPCAGAARCRLGDLPTTFASGVHRKGRSARGKPLTAGGRTYRHGLGVAAPSLLRWSLKDLPFRTLAGAVAHDDGIYPGQLAAVVAAEIYVDGEPVFHSGKLTLGTPPRRFEIDVSGAQLVELYAHDMDGLHYRNLVDWLDVELRR